MLRVRTLGSMSFLRFVRCSKCDLSDNEIGAKIYFHRGKFICSNCRTQASREGNLKKARKVKATRQRKQRALKAEQRPAPSRDEVEARPKSAGDFTW